ncbi:transcription regulator [Zea mays]|uniref:Transcription regulator n=1 Tax=Zea mays TaxID=4577 RepID=K7VY55_MAIZE|nr:transcription regulator [Zea mays]
MIPFNPAVAAEVRALIQGVEDSTFDPIYRELSQPWWVRFLLQVCVDEILLNIGGANNHRLKHDLVAIIFRYCVDKPYFSTNFCEALRAMPDSDGLLETLSNELELSTTERVVVGLALSDSENPDLNLEEMCLGRLDDDFDSHISKIGEQISLSDIISELGCGCTCNTTHCKEMLSLLEPLDDMGISKLLGAVVCTRIGVGEAQNTYSIFLLTFGNNQTIDSSQLTSWNIDVLVDSINEIDPFPLHAICGLLWNNIKGQLSFLKHAVALPNDTFTFAHCTRKMVFPDLGNCNQGNQAWYCLVLLEVLCQLAELGYSKPVRAIQPILGYPLINYPEVLLLGVSHINTAYNLIQHEVLSCVFPAVVKNTMHSSLMNYL